MAESIKTHGLRQPVEVRLVSGLQEPRIAQIIDGERRYRACKRAGLKQIACVIKEASDQEMAEVAMVANEQRKDLSLIEKARGYQRMMEEFGPLAAAVGSADRQGPEHDLQPSADPAAAAVDPGQGDC